MPSEEFLKFYEGRKRPCRLEVPSEPPDWYDEEKLRRGQRHFNDNTIGVLLTCLCNLIAHGFSLPTLSYPLVLTSKSETSSKAFKRYWDTVAYVSLWYELDPVKNSKPFQDICGFHKSAFKRFESMTIEDMRAQAEKKIAELPDSERIDGDQDLDDVLLANLRELRESRNEEDFRFYRGLIRSGTTFSELNMALTQISFCSSILNWPDEFGARKSSAEDLEGLNHLWRVNGYYLGMSDEFQAVKESREKTTSLLNEIIKYILIPAFLHLDRVSLHMAKTACKGGKLRCHVIIYTHYLLLGLELKRLWQHFCIKQKMVFYFWQFFMHFAYEFNFIRRLILWATKKLMLLNSVVKRFSR